MMPLSFAEKRTLQKVIAANLASLQASGLTFSEKRRLQKEIQDAFGKLKEKLDIVDTETAGEQTTTIETTTETEQGQSPEIQQNQKLADLIAGKYNNESPENFLAILKDIVEEINDIEPVKPPTITYIEANQEKVNQIMESALGKVFGKLWDTSKVA